MCSHALYVFSCGLFSYDCVSSSLDVHGADNRRSSPSRQVPPQVVTNNNVNRPDVGDRSDAPVAKSSIPAARLAPFSSAERDPSLFELGTVRLGCKVMLRDCCLFKIAAFGAGRKLVRF